MPLPALQPDNVAVVTGAAGGIGLAAARRFAGLGLKVCLADRDHGRLQAAARDVAQSAKGGADDVLIVPTDVSRPEEVRRLEQTVLEHFGDVHVLMNNAGVQPGSGMFGPAESWASVIGVNLWGVINGVQVFAPG